MDAGELIRELRLEIKRLGCPDCQVVDAKNGLLVMAKYIIESLQADLAAAQQREKTLERRLRYEWEEILPAEYTGVTHHLKLVQPHYDASAAHLKTFEIRKDDRGYAVGDILHLYLWDGQTSVGPAHYKQVTYVLHDEPYVPDGYVCLGVLPITFAAVRDARYEWRSSHDGNGDKHTKGPQAREECKNAEVD